MKVEVTEDCIACGLCEDACPEVFQLGDSDYAQVLVDEVPEEHEDAVRGAADDCPVAAIVITDD